MKILIAFSGGKDSQACLIWALNNPDWTNIKKEAVFCDTGWEHEDTYQHIQDVCNQLNVSLVILKSKYDFISLAKHKKRFPSRKAQFCTTELKVKPMIDYIIKHEENLIIIQGIRKQESLSRSQMDAQCSYFKYYFEPYGKKKFSYRGKDVRMWAGKYNADIIRPVFNWTGEEVMQYIFKNNQMPNPLYYRGMRRVGCYPCINCSLTELKQVVKIDSTMKHKVAKAEKQVGRSFFPPDRIPTYLQKNKQFPTSQEVFDYVEGKANIDNEQLFEPESKCMSIFNICE